MTHIISKPQQPLRSCCLKEVTPFTDEDTGIAKCLISVNTASKWKGRDSKAGFLVQVQLPLLWHIRTDTCSHLQPVCTSKLFLVCLEICKLLPVLVLLFDFNSIDILKPFFQCLLYVRYSTGISRHLWIQTGLLEFPYVLVSNLIMSVSYE